MTDTTAPAINQADDMYERAYWEIQGVLDEALGSEEENGAGMGIVADVRLLAQRYADLRAALLATGPSGWDRIAEIEASPLRCSHGLPVDEDCRDCIAAVMEPIHAKGEVKP